MNKKYLNNKTIIGILGIVLIAMLFIGSSYLANSYEETIQSLITSDNSVIGMVAYVFITTIAIVVAPISTLPLIPIAVSIWGWFLVGILSIVGWTIGSQIAFMLARRFGKSFIQKFYSLEKLQKVENKFS